jgi:hypothetical protein
MATATTPISPVGPARGVVAVTKSDTTVFSPLLRAIYIGGAGNVAVTAADGSVATFTAVPVGTTLHVACSKVMDTNTTATNILGLY